MMTKAERIAELVGLGKANGEIAAIVTREFGTFTRAAYVRACKQRAAGGGTSAADVRYAAKKAKEAFTTNERIPRRRGKDRLKYLSEKF